MAEKDDFDIELGQSVRRHIERKDSPARDRALVTVPYESPQDEQIPVFIAESAMRAMERHAAGEIDREVGGVLLGGFFRTDTGSFIEVTDVIEAEAAQGTDVSLTFTHETWEQIHSEQAARAPDSRIVGWYHSHPGLGVFMSKADEFIQSSFFADPWHVAVVVDPIYHNWGCFRWKDKAIDRAGGFFIFSEKKNAKRIKDYATNLNMARQSTMASAGANVARGATAMKNAPLWTAIVVLLALQVAVAIVALGRAHSPDNVKMATLRLEHSDLSGAEYYLRAELVRDPHRPNRAAGEMLRDLAVVHSDAEFRRLDDRGFDLANLSLYRAEQMVRSAADVSAPATTSFADDDTKGRLAVAAGQSTFLQPALDLYRGAAPTRESRLQRAKAIRSILLHQRYYRSLKPGKIAKAWFAVSVKWLEGEEQRAADLERQTNKDHD